jgi:general secretion pathway protein G
MRRVPGSRFGRLETSPGDAHARARTSPGFTIIELLAALTLIGLLAGIAIPKYRDLIEKARVAKAIGDIRAIERDLLGYDSLPNSLAQINRHTLRDPWGRAYVYLKFPPPKGKFGGPPASARRDRFLVPVNTEFDLYSLGKDGVTSPPFTAKQSVDDVVRANDGGFIGLAKNF